jgi:hypothetical protein
MDKGRVVDGGLPPSQDANAARRRLQNFDGLAPLPFGNH